MKIGIDLRLATLGESGGITPLLKGVLEALFTLHPEHDYVLFCTVFNRGLLERLPPRAEVRTLPLHRYFADLDWLARDRELDVLFRGYPIDSPSFPLARQIFLIPDIQHEYYPDFFGARELADRRAAFTPALAKGGAVGTISEFARRTLLEQPCTRCPDVFLMPPGLSVREAPSQALSPEEEAMTPAGDFFLYPANLWPHKNHRRVLQAFARFLQTSDRPMTFIFTGHPDGWDEVSRGFSELPIRHLGFVRPPVMRRLFVRAKALVYFSLYEGFGMPLLEAFDAGTPVLCSNTTSLPEVGGDDVLSCDPTDVDAMSALMGRICREESLRADLAGRAKRRLKSYTWEQSAENLFAAFGRVVDRAAAPRLVVPATLKGADLPLVSIVTPSYNQGRYLRRTIDSVLKQTYPRIEYCVMDGGSTDDSTAILKSYGDRFPWVSERDHGQTHAINKGFARSRGDILAYLNSDDVLMPDGVEKVVGCFLARPEWDMVYGTAPYIDEEDRITGWYNTADYSFKRLMFDCCVCQPAASWRASIARKVGPFDESLRYAMDYDYWIRIDRAGGRIEHLREPLACSRLYPQTKTLSHRNEIYKEILSVCLRRGGYVDKNYLHGFWDHLCGNNVALSMLARIPGFRGTMAYWHHKWCNRRRYLSPEMRVQIKHLLRRHMRTNAQRILGPRLFAAAKRILLRRPTAVVGFHMDNWLSPVCEIVVKNRKPGQKLYLRGAAPVDTTLTAALQGEEMRTYSLRANMPQLIPLGVASKTERRLQLVFSEHARVPGSRKVSFLLQDTNLFSEQDLA